MPSSTARIPALTRRLIARALGQHRPTTDLHARARGKLHFEAMEQRVLMSADVLPTARTTTDNDVTVQLQAQSTASSGAGPRFVTDFGSSGLSALQPLAPRGSLVHAGGAAGTLDATSEATSLAITVEAGQTVALRFQPQAGGDDPLQARLEVFDATDASLGFVAAGQPGEALQLQLAAAEGGPLRIALTRLAGAGDYTLELFLNARLEAADSTGMADAVVLDDVLTALPGGSGASGAVIGHLDPAGLLAPFARENFEGSLGDNISLSTTNPNAQLQPVGYYRNGEQYAGTVLRSRGDQGGSSEVGAAELGASAVDGVEDTLNEVVWTVDVTGRDNLVLEFDHWGRDPVAEAFSGDIFTGSEFADGVAASVDGGAHWVPITSLGSPSYDPLRYSIDLSAALAAHGVVANGLLQIRFQHADAPFAEDGGGGYIVVGERYWDNIVLREANGVQQLAPVAVAAEGTIYGGLGVLTDGILPGRDAYAYNGYAVEWFRNSEGGGETQASLQASALGDGAVTLDFGAAVRVADLELSLEDDDDYLVEYSLDGETWSTLTTFARSGNNDTYYGMRVRSTMVGTDDYQASADFEAVEARWIRVSGLESQNGRFAVGEMRAFTPTATSDSDGEDWYRIDIAQGQEASFALQLAGGAEAGVPPGLRILDAEGRLLALGLPEGAGGVAVHGFAAPAAGTYYVQVTGLQAGEYQLVTTRDALLGTATATQDLGATPVVVDHLAASPGATSNNVLRVAVHRGDGTLLALLNDNSRGIEAVSVAGAQIDTLAELAAFDVVVIGSSSYRDEYIGFAGALRSWVESGGGLVATGWATYQSQGSAGWQRDLDAVIPVATSSGYSYMYGGILDVGLASHPVVEGLNDFALQNVYTEYAYGGVDDGALTLATVSGQAAVVVRDVADGRSVYLGPTYLDYSYTVSAPLDRLLEQAIAWAAGEQGRAYHVGVDEGATLTITATPLGTGTGEPANTLVPHIAVFDADNTLLAESSDGTLQYLSTTARQLTVRLSAASGTGDVLLRVEGAQAARTDGFHVVATSADDLVRTNEAPAHVDLHFDQAVLLSSITGDSFTLDGNAVTTWQVLAGNRLRFFLGSMDDGAHTLALADGALTDIHGQSLSGWSHDFALDTTAPTVVASSITQQQSVDGAAVALQIDFSEALDTAYIDASDAWLVDARNGNTIPLNSFAYDAETQRLTLGLPALADGGYQVVLSSGYYGFKDLLGHYLDGDPDDGTQDPSDFVLSFIVDAPEQDLSVLPPLAPDTALVHGRFLEGGLDGEDDVDSYRIRIDAGQLPSVFVRPAPGAYADGSLAIALTVRDADGTVVAQATGAAGAGVLLQNLRAEGGGLLAAGTYRIEVRNAEGEGDYQIGVLLGAAVEEETAAIEGAANGSADAAQDITGAFLPLGQGGSSRGAVLGSLASDSDADYYRITLAAGESVDVVVAQALGSTPGSSTQGILVVDLLDAAGTLLARSVPVAGQSQQAILGMRVDASGSYLLRVHGSNTALHTLTVARSLLVELPQAAGQVPDISATHHALGRLAGSGGGANAGAIRVAVFNAGGGGSIVTQLNDDTWFNFDAVSVTADGLDTIEELRQFDVVIIGDSYGAQQYDSFAAPLRAWVEAGGGLVATGWTIYAAGASTAPALPDIDAIVPVNTSVAYRSTSGGTIDVLELGHPATLGIDDFYFAGSSEYSSGGADADATVLATLYGRPFAVVGSPGNGRSAYLGAVYYHDNANGHAPLDRLLEQTAAWAAVNRDDSYRVQVTAGDTLTITTQTPGDGPDAPANTLATRLELYDAQGTLVASNEGGAADGHNAVLNYTALEGGSYRVRVVALSGAGAYVVSVAGATGTPPETAPTVTAVGPTQGVALATPPGEIVVTLSEGVRADSVSASDLVLDTGGSATAVELLAGNRLRFLVDIPAVEGAVRYHFATGAFSDLQGTASVAFEGGFLIDQGGPRVLSSSPEISGNAPFSRWTFTFNEALDVSSVSSSDVAVFTSPQGTDLRGYITSITAEGNVLTVQFSSRFEPGTYTMALGPGIRDLAGNSMDQDQDGVAGEATEDRYTTSVALRSPDLVPVQITPPQAGVFGQTISVTWTVRNAGDGPTGSSTWYDRIWLSRDAVLDGNDTAIGTPAISTTGVAADGSYTRTAQFTLPLRTDLEAGSYYLLLQTDVYGYQGEANENNNVLAASTTLPITVPALPDLVVENVQAPAIIEAGKSVTFTWTQRNQGGAATTGGWYDSIYLSTDAQWGNTDLYVGERYFSTPLAAGASREVSTTFTMPTNYTGTWYVIVRGDGYNYVQELLQEGNNDTASATAVRVVVAAEDLVPTVVTAPPTASFGQTITVAWTVQNQGTGPTITNWTDRVWLSTDATVDGNDVALGNFASTGDTPLAAGASYQRSRDITLPLLSTLAGGTYYVLVQTDYYGQEPETNEANNVRASSAITVAVPPHADLAVSNVVVPSGARAGDTVAIRFTLSNLGTAAASNFHYRLGLSDSTTPGSYTHDLGTREFTDALAAGASIEITQQVTLPISAPGNWYVGVSADVYGQVYEYNSETNNHAVSVRTSIPLPPLPDLRVTNIAAPLDALSGQTVPISWTVANQGTGGLLSGGWVDRIYLSFDGGSSDSLYMGDFRYEGTLAAGASLVRTQNITLPADRTGNYTVVVITDAYGENYEYAGEGNNRTVDNTQVRTVFPPLPDLRVTTITPPSDAFSGTQTIVSWVVTNSGNGSTSAPSWTDHVVLSLNDVYGDGDDIALGSVANPSYLAAGDSYASSLTFTVPQGLSGDYRLLVHTDHYNAVVEDTGEANNVGVSALTHFTLTPPPDLRVTSVQAPPQVFSGQPMALTWTVTNSGTGRTPQTSWTDRVFVSTDAVLDAGDLELGRFAHGGADGALDAGEAYTTTQSVQLPVGSVGERWFFVVTDIYNQVYEHASENNNSGGETEATLVLLTPPPDLEVSSIVLPAAERAGNRISVQYTVTNYGATATAESYWFDNFYLSRDTVLDASDTLLGSNGHGGVLAVDGSYGATVSLQLPPDADGAWYLIVHTDAGRQVFEGFAGANGDPDANNISASQGTIAVAYRPANLSVESFTVPATGEAGKPVLIEWTLRNTGTGSTQANYWIDQVIASNDDILGDDDDILLASTSPGNVLAAGATLTQNARVTLPFGMEGNYRIYLRVDATNQVFEGVGEADNRAVQAMAVTRDTPDLRVTALAAELQMAAGAPLQVAWRVENQGANVTDANYWYDRVWLSLDTTLDSGDVLLASVLRGNPLAAGAGYDVATTLALPAGLAAGNYRLLLQTDARGHVTEGTAGETNNVRLLPEVLALSTAPVAQPDLRVTLVDAPPEAVSGQAMQVTWTVQNDSTDATGSRRWYDAVYLSRDLVFDRATDLYLGYVDHDGGLAAGGSYTQTRSFNVPLGQSGPFYVFVATDSGRVIAEAVETNNATADSGFVQVSLAPPADLVVGDITVPANAVPGRNATLTYTVHNNGTNAALGAWRDSIYLSLDDQWDIGDLFFGAVQHRGDVAGGTSYTESLTAALPGLTPGSYRVIVRSDILNAVPESREDNNLSASLDAVAIDMEALVLGTPATGTIATGQAAYYKITVSAGETVRVVLDSAGENNGNELYLRQGSMPTRGIFDHTGRDPFVADQMAVIPTTEAGVYYVMVYGADGAAARPYTLTASILPFSLQAVDQHSIGNAGVVTLRVDGAKFDAATQFALVNAAGENIAATGVVLQDSSRAYVSFDARGATLGAYMLAAVAADQTVASYAQPITVVTGNGAEIVKHIDGPAQVRPGRVILANLVYTNQGDADTMAPLFIVTSPTGTRFGSTAETIGLSSSVQLLGVASSGPQDILRPGDSNSLPLLFESVNAPMRFTTRAIEATSTEALDYAILEQSLRMPGMTDGEWQTRWLTQIQPRLGGTWGDYVRLVNALSKEYSTPERTISDVRELFDLAFQDNPGLLVTVRYSGQLLDATSGAGLAGVTVAMFRHEGTSLVYTSSAVTGADGRFEVPFLRAGTYSLGIARAAVDSEGFTQFDDLYQFDMNRNGVEDAAAPTVTLDGSADVTGGLFHAGLRAEVQTVQQDDSAPALAVDAAGRTHMVWRHEGVLWHAVNEGSGWVNAAPLPGEAGGSHVQLVADPLLIDDSSEGLLVTWLEGEGNEAEVYYAVGQRLADGSYRWTHPQKLTDNSQFDGAYAVGVDANGDPVLIFRREDATLDDDSDLYGATLDVDAPSWAADIEAQSEWLQAWLASQSDAELLALGIRRVHDLSAEDAALETSSSIVRYRYGESLGKNFPIIGGMKAEFRVDFQGQLGCDLVLRGNGALKFEALGWEIEGRAGGTVRYKANKDTCAYEFVSGSLNFAVSGAKNFSLSSLPIPQLYPLFTLIDTFDKKGKAGRFEIGLSGALTWNAGSDFPGWPSEASGTLRGSGGLNIQRDWGRNEVTLRLLINVRGKVEINNGLSLGFGDPPVSISALGRLKFGNPFSSDPNSWLYFQEFTWTYPGSGGTDPTSTGDLSSLEEMLAQAGGGELQITYGVEQGTPPAGTLNDYTGQGETRVTHDTVGQGDPVIAKDPSGRLWAAWDSSEGVVVSQRAGTTWGTATAIPGSEGTINSNVSLAFDGAGNGIAMWTRLDTSSLSQTSSSAEIQAVFENGGELVFARYDAATGQWSMPQVLMDRAGDESFVSLQRMADGDIVAAWIGLSSTSDAMDVSSLYTARWSMAGGAWSPAQEIAVGTLGGDVRVGMVGGAATLVWSQKLGATQTVLRQSVWDGTAWSQPTTVTFSLAEALAEARAAGEAAAAAAAADAQENDATLSPSAGVPWSPPDECCDEPDDPPYDPEPVVPRDPNDILGPNGFGDEHWIPATDTLAYTIRFENAADAAAPAQEVVVTQQLDADLDWRTFRVDDFGFGDQRVTLDGTTAFYQARLDLSETKGYLLDVTASIDTATGLVTWRLRTLDPATGELPLDAQLGFLPPNRNAEGVADGRGEGFLSYTIKAKRNVATGTVIDAAARIVFDTEEPIDTPPIFHTLDAGLPTSQVTVESSTSDEPVFKVQWAGSDADGGSALGSYTVYVSINGAPWFAWMSDTTLTEALYEGEAGNTYRFYSVARDNAGNQEAAPLEADATVQVTAGVGTVTGVVFDDQDGDGSRDAGEGGLAGWTLFLDMDADGVLDTDERSVVTDADGAYRFDAVVAGAVTVGRVLQGGWLVTAPAGNRQVVDVVAGATVTGADFGSVRAASITGRQFNDLDGDGSFDLGETVLAGWTVFLDTNANGNLDAGERSTVTDADGRYRFDNLLPGSYTVAQVLQSGWLQTAPSAATGAAGLDPISGSAQELELPDADLDLSALDPSATSGNGWASTLTGLSDFRNDPRFAGIDGRGMSVVVIDTGIDLDHAFFGPDTNGDGIADRIVYQYDFANDDADASDRNNHGSHIAGIVGGNDAVYGGVATGVDLIALKVFQDNGTGYFSYLENALRWVVNHAEEFNVGVINLSLGDGGNWNTAISRFGLADELAALAEMNIIVTAASGNHFAKFGGAWGVAYPAADPSVLAVGATWTGDLGGPWNFSGGASDYSTGADHIASFTQRDDELLDVMAPGARLTSANASGGTTTMQGTSQASAYMAGIAVLAQDLAQQTLGRRLSLAEFSALLDATSVRIVDGDDENDNVRNSGLSFQRVDMLALAEAILLLPVGGGGTPGGGTGTQPGHGGGGGASTPSAGPASHSITVTAGETRGDVDFGNFRLGRIDGVVFHDRDADGVQAAGEDGAGLAGWTVFLDANQNGVADTGESSTVTDAQGRYQFADLGPGARRVVLAQPEGWTVLAGSVDLTVTSGLQAQTVLAVNARPTLPAIDSQQVNEGSELHIDVAASDSSGSTDTLAYALVGEVPEGASIDAATGVFRWTAPDGDTSQAFVVQVRDSAGGTSERSFTVQVRDVAPTLSATGAATSEVGQGYVLQLSAADPGQDTITHWTIDWGDGIVQTVQGNPAQVAHGYAAAGSFAITATAHDEDGNHAATGPVVQVAAGTLRVTAFAATATGFALRFNRIFDASALNIHDATTHARGASDIVFADASGRPVDGSVVLDADGRGLRFVKTGGVLAAGNYSVRLNSGATAFATLDGDGNGTAGDAYTTSFSASTGGAVLSIGEIARGPGQPVNLPADGSGFPITLSNAAGATSISFTLRYDTRLLVIAGVNNGAGLPAGSSLSADLSVPGELRVTITTSAPLGAGTVELLRLQSSVRPDARYGSSQVLDLQSVRVNNGAIPVRDDDGVHIAAYLGDTTGNRSYAADDVALLQRVLTRADSGFGAFPLTDPMLLGDVNASGTLTSLDAARLQQQVNGAVRPELPPIPVITPEQIAASMMEPLPRIEFSGTGVQASATASLGASGSDWLSDWLVPEAAPQTSSTAFKLTPTPAGLKLTPATVATPVAPVLTRL